MRKRLFGSQYFKHLAILASGSVIGALITAVSEVARTWIFSPEAVGIYTFLLAFPLLFISVPSLRYDIAIVVEKDEHRALALVKLSFWLIIIVSALTTVAFAIYIFGFHQDYMGYWYIIPFCFVIVAGYGTNNVLNAYNNRNKEYKEISRRYVIRTAIQRGAALLFGVILVTLFKMEGLSVLIMIAPHGLGLFVGAWRQARGIRARKDEYRSITKKELWEAAKEHRKQALYSSPALFVNSYSYSCITFQIEELFDSATVGYYSISNRVLGMPISLISGNVAKVYIEESAKEYRNTGRFFKATKKSLLFLTAMAIPMLLAMMFLAPPICTKLLGTKWHVAGEYIRILSVMFAFRLVGTALSQSLAVCKRQGIELLVNIGLVAASLFSGFLTKQVGGDIYFFLKSICISRSICYVLLIGGVVLCSLGTKKSRAEAQAAKQEHLEQPGLETDKNNDFAEGDTTND